MLGGGKDIRPRSGRMGYGIHGTGMAMVGKIRRNSPFLAPRLKRQDRLFSKGLSDPPHGGTIMSESMRMQSQLTADLEVYRAKGELIALRAENARLKECLRECVSCIEVLSMRGVDHDECGTVESAIREGWWCNMAIDARTHALVALQPERGKP